MSDQSEGVFLKKIFVVGFPRSGTTLLQSLIAQSSEIISFPETHLFFREFIQPLDRLPFSPNLSDRFWLQSRDRGVDTLLKALPDLLNKLPQRHDLIHSFSNCMESYEKTHGYAAWLEKTPGHIRRIPVIKSYYEDAKFLHIIRRFQAVKKSWKMASSFSDSPFKRNPRKIFRNWRRDIKRTLYWVKKEPNNHFVIFYPRLCAEPNEFLTEVSSFLNIQISYDSNSVKLNNNLILSDESWKVNNKKQIFKPSDLDLYNNLKDKSEIIISKAFEDLDKHKNIFI